MIRGLIGSIKSIVLHNLGDRWFFIHIDIDVVPTQAIQAYDLARLFSTLQLLNTVFLLLILIVTHLRTLLHLVLSMLNSFCIVLCWLPVCRT